ncbi:MAG: hypothetical protein HYX82_04205 [Chloroflexi bacterium]|nr:hypothetical protein [Chloroflexota bacterium]
MKIQKKARPKDKRGWEASVASASRTGSERGDETARRGNASSREMDGYITYWLSKFI